MMLIDSDLFTSTQAPLYASMHHLYSTWMITWTLLQKGWILNLPTSKNVWWHSPVHWTLLWINWFQMEVKTLKPLNLSTPSTHYCQAQLAISPNYEWTMCGERSTAPLTPVRNLTPAPQLLFDNPKAILESLLWLLNSKLADVLDLIGIDKHSFNNNSKINNFSKLTLIINNNKLICNNHVVILLGRLNLIVHIVGVLTSRDQNRPSGFQRRQ